MDISLEEVQGGKLFFRASNRSLPGAIFWSYMYWVANCILEEELYILLDDAIVEVAIHKTLDLREEPNLISHEGA
jgi:hypothetical protein